MSSLSVSFYDDVIGKSKTADKIGGESFGGEVTTNTVTILQ